MASIRTYNVTAQFIGKDNKTYIREFVIAASNANDAKAIAYNRLPLYLTKSATPIADNNIKFTIIDNGIIMNNKTYYSSPIFPRTYKDIIPEPSKNMPIPPDADANTYQTALNNTAMSLMLIWGRVMMTYVLEDSSNTEQIYLAEKLMTNINNAIDFCNEWASLYVSSMDNQELEEFFIHTIQEKFNSAKNRNEQLDSDQRLLNQIQNANINVNINDTQTMQQPVSLEKSENPVSNDVNTPENTDEDTPVSNDVNTPENTDIPDEFNNYNNSFDTTDTLNELLTINNNDDITTQDSNNTNETDTPDINNSSVNPNTNSNNYVWIYDPIQKTNIKVKKPV